MAHSIEVMLRELLTDEEKAVSQYIKVAEQIENEEMKRVLMDIAEEEKIHKGELIRLLKEIGIHDKFAIRKGEEEVSHMLMQQRLIKVQDMLNNMAYKNGTVPNKVVVVPQTREEAEEANIIPRRDV